MILSLLVELMNRVNRLADGELTIGSVTVGAPGEPPSAYFTGTYPFQVLNLVLPYVSGGGGVGPGDGESPVALDTDGQPFFSMDYNLGAGIAFFLDTDGQPYFNAALPYSAGDLDILFDTDSQPYFVSGA